MNQVVRYLMFFFFLGFFSLHAQQADELFNSIKNGSLPGVKKELSKGVNINSLNILQKTPLIYATEMGEATIVKFILNYDDKKGNKTAIDAVDKDGKTALIQSVIYGNPGLVKILIDSGVYLNTKDKNGKSALMYATEKGDTEVIQLLTSALTVYSAKITELIYKEIDNDNESQFDQLIEDGADLNNTIIYAIQKESDKYIKKLIIKGANFQDNFFYNKKYSTFGIGLPLQWACYKGDVELAEFLVTEKKVDVNQVPTKGDFKIPSLIFAIQSKNLKLVEYLLKNNVSLDNELYKVADLYPIIEAVKILHIEIINILIKNNCDIKVQNRSGFSALYFAFENINEKPETKQIFEILLKSGADINGVEGGLPLLMQAIQKGNPEKVDYLLTKKPDINQIVSNNKFYNGYFPTAIKMAFGSSPRNKNIIKSLLVAGAKPELEPDYEIGVVIWSVGEGDTEFTEMLIKKGININYFDIGKSVIEDINIYMLQLFIKYGLDVNIKNADGKTLLFVAATANDQVNAVGPGSGSYEIVDLLVKSGADIKPVDLSGKSVIDYCVSKKIKSYLQYNVSITKK